MDAEQLGLIDRPPTPEEIRRQMRAYTVRYVALVALVSLVIGGLIGRLTAPGQAAPTPPLGWRASAFADVGDNEPQLTRALEPLQIYVSGAVLQPRVVEVPGGSILSDALDAAGGPAPEADLDNLNLAAPLANHQHVHVPARESVPTSAPRADVTTPRVLVNVNTATLSELLALPGIGEIRAQAILAYRAEHGPFARIEDLQNVSGVGPATYEGLVPYVTVGP